MEREKNINTISILGFIFAFILFPVGLVLSIIGLVKGNKLKKEEEIKPKYYVFSIIGLIISIINFVVISFVFGLIALVFNIVYSYDDEMLGNYTCDYPRSSLPAVSAEFKNGRFKWGKYGDSKNYVYGSYRITSRKINNNVYEYQLKLRPNIFNTKANISTKKYYYITIKQSGNNTTITFDNSTIYNCHKVGVDNDL